MNRIVFLGDELSAAGFRLAGAEARVPAAGAEAELFEAALIEAALVLVTAEIAARLPPARLARALAATRPLTLIVPDVRGRAAPPDLGQAVRGQLGIEG